MPSYYKPRTDDELQKQAAQQYQSYYDQLRTAAQQKSARETTALENQRAGIQSSFQRQREESDKSYRQAYSQADRETLRRGMQRSSYAAQTLANVNQRGIEAGQKIMDEQRTAEGNLDAQIAQIAGQLGDTLAGYDANQAADVLKRYNELQGEEYERGREAEQYAESIRQWQASFDQSQSNADRSVALNVINSILANGKDPSDELLAQAGISRADANAMKKDIGGGGGGYYGRSSGGSPGKTKTKPDPINGASDTLMDQLAGGGTDHISTTPTTPTRTGSGLFSYWENMTKKGGK